MTPKKRNAIIMAAGTSSRFVPLSAECPKGLLEVKGEILIERQIRQLCEAGISDITVVTGYKASSFEYLRDKFGVDIVYNEDYNRYNNTSSMIRVLDRLSNTFVCSSDNYFPDNVFLDNPGYSYYSALYANGVTGEYCLDTDDDDSINSVSVGGADSWYMIGHVFFSEEFSRRFAELLRREYEKEETRQGYWEDVYIRFIDILPKMKIRRYKDSEIKEFDTLDELRCFDVSYIDDTRSTVIKDIARELGCNESGLTCFIKEGHLGSHLQFTFMKGGQPYRYNGLDKSITAL